MNGTVFDDHNGNGLQEAVEPGLAEVTVKLFAPGLDAVLGTADDVLVGTTTTAANGSYAFASVSPGSYLVQETDLSGYTSTTSNAVALSVAAGATVTVNFGDQALASVSGVVFNDLNGNGIQDQGESGLNGVYIQLVGPGSDGLLGTADDVVVDTATTAGNGSYVFFGVAAGSYLVQETDLPGFVSTTSNSVPTTVGAGGTAAANFGDLALAPQTVTPTATPTATPTPTPFASGQDVVLTIAKAADQAAVSAGAILTYTIDYSNIGTSTAFGAVVTEFYDPNVTFVDAVPPPDTGTTDRWSVGDLAQGDGGQITVRVLVRGDLLVGSVLTNRATLSSGAFLASTTVTTSTTPNCLSLRMSDSDLFAGDRHPGTLVRVTMRFADPCNGATSLTLVNTLPAEVTFVSVRNGGVYANGAVTWQVARLRSSQTASVSFVVLINANVIPGTVIGDTATLTESQGSATGATDLIRTLRPHPDGPPKNLSLSGKAPSSNRAGRAMSVSFRYKNLRVGGQVSVLLPLNESVLLARPAPGSIGPSGTLVWSGNSLPLPSGVVTLKVQPPPDAVRGTVLTHTAVVTSTAGDSCTASVDTIIR